MKLRLGTLLSVFLLFNVSTGVANTLDFALGKTLFDRIWTPAPASTDATDGLGPLFNARSCVSCHAKGGRGTFKETKDGHISGLGLVLRIGDSQGQGDRTYGVQLQTLAVQGYKPEGKLARAANGTVQPINLAFGALEANIKFGGRLAPTLRGLGLLERVPEHQITEWADENDLDHNQISGRPNYVIDGHGNTKLGRFGWKAGKTSIRDQSGGALSNDLGLSNPVAPDHYGDCRVLQTDCRTAPHGGSVRFGGLEISEEMLSYMVSYVQKLPAPVPQAMDAEGIALFRTVGCAQCHRSEFVLENGVRLAAFTDLLVHDMGSVLADGIGDGSASGREWRTAPLWGLRNAKRYLHDGRAKSVRQAILLHGGEATASRLLFKRLPPVQKDTLLKFLNDL